MTAATSTIVGALACQKNSFLKTLNTKVVSSYEFVPPATAKEKQNKNKKDSPKELKYGVEFEDTVLFPEGGGQPFDKGTITILNNGAAVASEPKTVEVNAILRDKLKAVHIVDEPLEPGTQVKLQVDWDRRLDIMQQHTGQHLLSAVFDTLKLDTLSWSMGDIINYIELPEKVSDEVVQQVQQRVNELIFEAHPIHVVTRDDHGVEIDTSHLPDDYDQSKGVVRIVKIGDDIDSNPCCGTHLSNTAQIGSIVLLNQTSIRGGHSRLYFTCGTRVANIAGEYFDILKTVSGTQLSCQIDDVVTKIDQLNTNYRKANSTIANLTKELANLKATEIFNKLKATDDGIAYVYREENNPDYLTTVQKELATIINANKDSGVDITNKHTLILINGNQTSNGGMVKISGPKTNDIATELKLKITNLKGGGKGLFQGKITKYEKGEIESVLSYLDSL